MYRDLYEDPPKEQFLDFVEGSVDPKMKTKLWGVFSHGGVGQTHQWPPTLGTVKWFARWRRYAFFPSPDCVFDAQCLAEIGTFITNQMLLRSPARKYNPEFGDDRICGRKSCGHTYYRHFDWGNDYLPGCKYCHCSGFVVKRT